MVPIYLDVQVQSPRKAGGAGGHEGVRADTGMKASQSLGVASWLSTPRPQHYFLFVPKVVFSQLLSVLAVSFVWWRQAAKLLSALYPPSPKSSTQKDPDSREEIERSQLAAEQYAKVSLVKNAVMT